MSDGVRCVFGRGGRRKRRRHRVVPPKGASRLWPKTHEEVRRLQMVSLLLGAGAALLLTPWPPRGAS